MRKLVILAAAILLAGCGLSQEDSPNPESTKDHTLSTPTASSPGSTRTAIATGSLEAPALPWLTVEGPETGGGPDTTVTWRATLTTRDGAPLAGRKLILSLNHEGNREIPALTDAEGRASFDLRLSDSEVSSCCVDGATEPTRYVIRIRFDGDASTGATFVDAYQGYRSSTADGIATQTRIEQSSQVVQAGDVVHLSVQFKKAGSPLAGVVMVWESLDLGQYPRCTTDASGRCTVSFTTEGRPTGSYGISVMPRTNRPATDAITIHIVNDAPPNWAEQAGGWYWWQHDGSPNPSPTAYQQLGIFYQYEMRSIVTGWDEIKRRAVLNTRKLDTLIDQAYARRYTFPDGTIGPQPVLLGYWLNTQVPPQNTDNPLGGGDYLRLSCAGGVATPPLHEAEFRTRLNTIPQAFREWYDRNPKAQAVVVGFVFGAGFHGEWANPFSDSGCNSIYQDLTGSTISNQMNRHERETEAAWSQAFAGTTVVLNTQGPGDAYAAALSPPISPKFSQTGWVLGNSYKSNPPQRWSWGVIGRAKNTLLSCEDGGSNFIVGGAFGNLRFPGHWSPAWLMTAQAAHFRCYQLHADLGDGFFDAFEVDGIPSIPNLDTLAKEVITALPCEDRRLLAWWAHEAALGFRKTDEFPRSGGVGWASDIYGDFEACLVRREVEPTTPLLRNDLPMPARVDYFVNPASRPGTLPWTGDGNQPTDTGVAFSARRGTAFYFDVHDGFAARHPPPSPSQPGGEQAGVLLRVVYLNNGGDPLTVEWATVDGTGRAELPRGNDGAWASETVELAGFVSRNDAFPAMTDLKVSGANVVLTHASVGVAVATPPPAPTATPSPSATATPSSQHSPSPTVSPTSTQTGGQVPIEPEAMALATRVAEVETRLGQLERRQSAVERLLDRLEQILTEGLQRLTDD